VKKYDLADKNEIANNGRLVPKIVLILKKMLVRPVELLEQNKAIQCFIFYAADNLTPWLYTMIDKDYKRYAVPNNRREWGQPHEGPNHQYLACGLVGGLVWAHHK
jgi:hypothetical protein